jgi:hypothetical protein
MVMNIRSRITVRYTTNPADMGYSGTPSNWETLPGETMGIRAALSFSHALTQRVGQGIFRRIRYSHNGLPVTVEQLQDIVDGADYRKYKGVK